MNKKRKEIIASNEISKLCTFNLGGYEQRVLLEGRSSKLPILISLHGGPGTPIPFSAGGRGLFPEFTNRFILVSWDQLGCGINDHKIDDSFTIDSFVQMGTDLVGEIRKLFPNNKIYIFSTSWGSVLSARMLEKEPKLVDGVVACGQIVKNIFFNEATFDALRKSKLPAKKLQEIESINMDNVEPKDLQLISSSLMKYTNAYQNKNGKSAPMGSMIMGLMASPDYKLKDFKAVMVNGYRGNRSLWNELLTIDLTEVLSGVEIPYTIIQGDTDVVAVTKTVKKLVKSAGNDLLTCYVVENTGHMPGAECMEYVLKLLSKMVGAKEMAQIK